MIRQFVLRTLPPGLRSAAKQARYHWLIRGGRFRSPEPEYRNLSSYCGPGDWVLDIGANVGHYSCRLSALVGSAGRVFAFEPIPETAALLASNIECFPHRNVTLLNLAVGNRTGIVNMKVPVVSQQGDLYLAKIDEEGE